MADDIAVLLGPTLPVAEARRHLDALYLPPAEQGSVLRAILDHRPAIVAIVDGVFAQRPAVRHKEILWAMANGVEVHGAASMGALRAAELAPYGMVGHGFVYRWYRRTPLADDEEVAVAMAPPELGSAALGEALINMRVTLRLAERRGIVSRALRTALEGLARARYFLDRTYAAMLADARAALPDPAAPRRDRRARTVAADPRRRPQADRRRRAPAPPRRSRAGRPPASASRLRAHRGLGRRPRGGGAVGRLARERPVGYRG